MISLTGGVVQNANGSGLPNGSVEFCLNVDAMVVAAPNGFVSSKIPIVFQLDANGNIEAGAEIWSNEELNPQTVDGLGTYYIVTFYDKNNARISEPQWWLLNQSAGGTVDIGTMMAFVVGSV